MQQYLRDLRKWGIRGKAILKSDGENAIVSLLERIGELRQAEIIFQQSPVSDSRANGRAERAVQKIQKKARVLKLATEEHLEIRLAVDHPAFALLVEHAADVLNKTEVASDGRTPWERLKTRAYTGLMFEFGTEVFLRAAEKPVGGAMTPRWVEGVWLGKRFTSEEHIVSLASGKVVRSGTVRPHPEVAFDVELFNAIQGAPWDPQATGVESQPTMSGRVPETSLIHPFLLLILFLHRLPLLAVLLLLENV